MRIIISNKFAKLVTKLVTREYVCQLSRLMHLSYGWWCVCNEMSVGDYIVNKSVIKNWQTGMICYNMRVVMSMIKP